MITIGQAAKILGKTKRTLMRWHESRKFLPKAREKFLKSRLYDKEEVENLRTLLQHEKRYQTNLKQLHKIHQALNPYAQKPWLSEKEGELLKEEKKLKEEHDKLFKEFERFKPEIKRLYKQFFMKEK